MRFARVQLVAEMPVDAQMGSIFNYTTDFNRVTKPDVSEVNLPLLKEIGRESLFYLHHFSRGLSWIRNGLYRSRHAA